MPKPTRKEQEDAARSAAQQQARKNDGASSSPDMEGGADDQTSFVTSSANEKVSSVASQPLSAFTKKPAAWQNAVYFFLVVLSVCSLLYLVFVSMQPVVFSPSAMLNGTWHVSASHGDIRSTTEEAAASAVSRDAAANANDDEKSDSGDKSSSNKKNNNKKKTLLLKNIVSIDLHRFVDFSETEDTLEIPQEAMPIDLAPQYLRPIDINTPFRKGYSGGAKVLHWTGPCKTVTASAATCTLMLYRGHWAMSAFPGNLSNAAEFFDQSSARHSPITLIATRLDDSAELVEEVQLNKKIKYVLIIMGVVAIIHHALSSFQPPSTKKLRRDAAYNKLMELRRQKEANEVLAKEKKNN